MKHFTLQFTYYNFFFIPVMRIQDGNVRNCHKYYVIIQEMVKVLKIGFVLFMLYIYWQALRDLS